MCVKAHSEGCKDAVTTDSDVTEIRSCHIHEHSPVDVNVIVPKAHANMNEGTSSPQCVCVCVYMLECKYTKRIHLDFSIYFFFLLFLMDICLISHFIDEHLSGGHLSYNRVLYKASHS